MFANGDIDSAEDAVRVMSETSADGVMIGRGAVGNPFLFSSVRAALGGEDFLEPSLEERKAVAMKQLGYAIEEKGEHIAVREARGQLAKYFHSFHGCAELRARINRAQTAADIEAAIASL